VQQKVFPVLIANNLPPDIRRRYDNCTIWLKHFMENKQKPTGKEQQQTQQQPDNKSKQGVDKTPEQDKPTEGKLTESDLKGKKVDRDISDPNDEPLSK
jgi:hypothetical protein